MQACIVYAIASHQQARFKVATRLNSTLKLANQPKYELAASFLCLLGTAPKTALQCLTEVVKQFEKRKSVVLQ